MNTEATDLEQLRQDVTELKAQMDRLQHAQTTQATDADTARKLDRLNFYRREDAQEWTLLTNRINSYIMSQAFLVTAYAASMGNSDLRFRLLFPLVVCAIGIIASLRAYPGIDGACKVIQLWHDKKELLLRDPCLCDYCDGRVHVVPTSLYHRCVVGLAARSPIGKRALDGLLSRQDSDLDDAASRQIDQIHIASLYFAHLAPKLFGYAWVVLLALALVLHFTH